MKFVIWILFPGDNTLNSYKVSISMFGKFVCVKDTETIPEDVGDDGVVIWRDGVWVEVWVKSK